MAPVSSASTAAKASLVAAMSCISSSVSLRHPSGCHFQISDAAGYNSQIRDGAGASVCPVGVKCFEPAVAFAFATMGLMVFADAAFKVCTVIQETNMRSHSSTSCVLCYSSSLTGLNSLLRKTATELVVSRASRNGSLQSSRPP